MHIPDGLLDPATAAVTTVAGVGAVGYALKKARDTMDDRRIPIVGVTAAFVFAAQMVTLPIAGGTSAHLLGGAMAGIMLGPWVGLLVMAVVYTVQAIGFADGGITALGANILAMGLIPAVGGYYLFRLTSRFLPKTRVSYLGQVAGVSWITVLLASGLVSIFIVLGGPLPLAAFPIMLGIHALVGILEAGISTAVLGAVLSTRPDVLANQDRLPAGTPVSGGQEVAG